MTQASLENFVPTGKQLRPTKKRRTTQKVRATKNVSTTPVKSKLTKKKFDITPIKLLFETETKCQKLENQLSTLKMDQKKLLTSSLAILNQIQKLESNNLKC